jgi:FkbM family methyltransferase
LKKSVLIDRISQHAFLSGPLSPRSVIIDLGANNGEFCIEVAGKYGSRVLALEPVPELAAKLVGRSPLVTVLSAAVGPTDGSTTFNYDLERDKTGTAMGIEVVGEELPAATRSTIEVKMVSLATLFAQTSAPVVDLLKVDIEGLELEVLSQADEQLLRRCKQITVEFHDFWYPQLRQRTEQVKSRLRKLGFHMIRFTPNNRDVLFINETLLPLSFVERVYAGSILRNWYGFGRLLRYLWRNAAARVRATA